MLNNIKAIVKKIVRPNEKTRPNITQEWFPAKTGLENGRPLLITVKVGFNQDILRASTLLTLGYARGWAEACGPAKIIWEKDLLKESEKFENPVIYTNIYNYPDWGKKEIITLKKFDNYCFVNVHPKKYKEFSAQHPLNDFGDAFFHGGYEKAYKKLVESEPSLVCSFAGTAAEYWYNDWRQDGFNFDYVKLAADPLYYYPDPAPEKYGQIKMAYVGGYWPEKAQGFDLYLRPFEEHLHTYGYGNWPYKHYGGKITTDEERQLYSSAGMIPLVHGPVGWAMAEMIERYFKAPACRAFCIADQNPGVRDDFTEDEMLQAENPEHFKVLVNDYLQGKIDVEYWKNQGYRAVAERHLYKHRALQIKKLVENK